jgi:polysaccharide biosynthesis/export protein
MNKIFCFQSSLILLIAVLFVSCMPFKEVKYFNDLGKIPAPANNPREQKKILPFDNLYIKVLSTDEKNALIFNTSDPLRSDLSTALISYLVDEKGNVNFPFVGDINIGGLTTSQASAKIQKALSEYISNTAVLVKFIDNKVTVMGEVNHQGVFPFTSDKINIYDAIALAGGFTRYGSHKNIYLIRQVNNELKQFKLDLSNSKIIGSENYYILPNDVIVVEPLRNISWSYENITYSTVLTTITTLIAVLVLFQVKF